ncbi:hypothetical protein PV729_24460 [Streptomyces europaeiscabiei]|uniref:Uncharacterized protein n=1 Tax=Streptomyces europaeiscabiei TaxID=146819 RepID=A0ABU4NI91_9ACTN|nr:hypothetical protein [Streptomyces europaeiscabiei]MDX2767647.1 hypothetical protein [Streptomyces europaeiscabiei]MDX3545725.1 hypothetical protein [Streptomyces europaeiscabiei]MDX3554877.1 hypothetical protein [Streptomyces europaeiscabiei]MDX3702856.1 hypothetical protein [Streptomyces europaeiscabiei]
MDWRHTRVEVLKTEALTPPEQGPNRALTGGLWYSPYDDRHLDGARSLGVSHLVRSPKSSTAAERNDHRHPRHVSTAVVPS